MEILSDATFKGNLTISSGDFSVTRKGENNPVIETGPTCASGGNLVEINGKVRFNDGMTVNHGDVYINGGACISGRVSINNGAYIVGGTTICGSLDLSGFNTITANGKSITFPSTAGTLALTSQIPTVPSMAGVAHFCSIQINFDVATDCTRFYVGRTPNLPYGPASLQMFTDRLPNGGTGYYLKNVDLGVEKIDMGNPYIFVEKSSSFAISASDGYSVRIVY